MMDKSRICLETKGIKGFLDKTEGQALYQFACSVASLGPCLEVGSYCGKSALYLGTACRETDNVLFSIDHHRGSEEQQPGELYFDPDLFDFNTFSINTFPSFKKTIIGAHLEDTVVPLVCTSSMAAKAWQTPLGLVFIDGGHAYETVKEDYDLWHRHIVFGGYLIMHDIYSDPQKGGQAPYHVYRQAVETGLYEETPIIGSLGILKRI